MRYGLVAVDGFTKVVSVIPFQSTQVNGIIRGFEQVFAIMGKPQQIYSDEEGAMNSDTVLTFINTHTFKHIQTSTHAHAAERFIQTFRMILQRRFDATKESTDEWTKHVKQTLLLNIIMQFVIQIEPNKAKSPSDFLWVAWHLQNAANNNIKYAEIVAGDYVRVDMKPKSGITKGHHPIYYSTKHKVINTQGNDFLIEKLYHRHELLLVKCILY